MYSDSIQGKSDSIYYSLIDSVFKFYKDPVIWSNGNQISGDSIMLTTKNKQADQFIVDQNAISISTTGDGLFNQLRGSKLIGIFNIIPSMDYSMKIMYFCTKRGYEVEVFNHFLSEFHPHVKAWKIEEFKNEIC
jgi:hypothetical protein